MKNILPSRQLLASIPVDRIVAIVTSAPEYSMSRLIYVEDWPNFGDHTIIEGSHCSCFGFDDTRWDGTVYTLEELRSIAGKWAMDGVETEKDIAPFIRRNLA